MFRKAIGELSYFLRRADVVGGCRVTITFDNPRDTAFFEREVLRELNQETLYSYGPITGLRELTIYGIRVRIL